MSADEQNSTPGEMLRAARKKAGLSLEQVAETTRIAPNVLRALELDEYHKVSGDLYAKSFLQTYSREVGLETEVVIDAYLTFTGAGQTDATGDLPGNWSEDEVQIKKVGLPWGLISGVLVLVAAVAGFFIWLGRDNGSSAGEETTSGPVAAVLPSNDRSDTLAGGWQLERERPDSLAPGNSVSVPDSNALSPALPGSPGLVFKDGRHWPFVVRLTSEQPGNFEAARDAETLFRAADFSDSPLLEEDQPLAAGKAYRCVEGFVVYWGVDDHLSLRLGRIHGVSLTINGVAQDLGKYRDGEEILLDASRLGRPAGN